VVEVAAAAAHVFGEQGCTVEEPPFALDAPYEAFVAIFATNAYAAYGTLLENRADELTEYGRRTLGYGSKVTGSEYARAVGYVDRLKARFSDLFERYDLLLSPTMAVPAFPVGAAPTQIDGKDVDPVWGFVPFTFPINMVGHPAASIPCGFSSDGMPIGLHVVGRSGGEETVIAASAAFERARPWIHHRPPIS
jgi:aspartyl-tRNA(Asn)/glutamyl-tRNA(Gln) amidotransferase subunit A